MAVNQPRRLAQLFVFVLCVSPALLLCTADNSSVNCHPEFSDQTTDVVGLTFGENIATETNSDINGVSSTLEVLPTEACSMHDLGGKSSINLRPPPQEILFATKKLRSSRPKISNKGLELQCKKNIHFYFCLRAAVALVMATFYHGFLSAFLLLAFMTKLAMSPHG
eukprot:GHVT01043322.1.p1 GENE.GHVT01043322.1~~GHVT01043322.1.p1  ORF type:complete len:166 (+),score=13.48 GHVT01043322.1:1500-1997(+)